MRRSALERALDRCRVRAARFFAAQRLPRDGELFWRHSVTHDPARNPAHLLYGTWGGLFGTLTVGGPSALSDENRVAAARALVRFQRPDGAFLPELPPEVTRQDDPEYDVFHWTNYAWGALRAIGGIPVYPPTFLAPYLTAEGLAAWLARRDLARPWSEGNNVVNLASFLALVADGGVAAARERLAELRTWHDEHQHSRTGFWHSDAPVRTTDLEYCMAGAAHVLHLYYYLGAPVPNVAKLVESCIALEPLGIESACIDLDMVDLLSHLRCYGHRITEIDRILRRYLIELLQVQNADGGFCDNYVTEHAVYGEVTPPGVSVTWVTWFRLATIGMSACALIPDERERWWFRETLGSGYTGPAITLRNVPPATSVRVSAPVRALWTARRETRWLRQRITRRARRLLRGS
jgi:hypothetical protein